MLCKDILSYTAIGARVGAGCHGLLVPLLHAVLRRPAAEQSEREIDRQTDRQIDR